MNNTAATAIARKKPSVPARMLNDAGLLRGRVLDYGCGRGTDADAFIMESFDPKFQPEMPTGKFDTILCTYVLNVIASPRQRISIITRLRDLLSDEGKAYLTVRTDKAKLRGTTSKGTWQGLIEINLPTVLASRAFTTYELTRNEPAQLVMKATIFPDGKNPVCVWPTPDREHDWYDGI